MTICAVCQISDGLVVNVIIAELTDVPPIDCQLILTPTESGSNAFIGFYWDGTEFINPNPIVEE